MLGARALLVQRASAPYLALACPFPLYPAKVAAIPCPPEPILQFPSPPLAEALSLQSAHEFHCERCP